MGVSLDDGAGNMSPLRDFSYNAAGQLVADTRTSATSENIYSYGINARDRMTTVSLGGARSDRNRSCVLSLKTNGTTRE